MNFSFGMKVVRPADGVRNLHPSDSLYFPKIAGLFLVGPTPRSPEVKSWRPEALDILADLKYQGYVFVPEPFLGDYQGQIYWETACLTASSVIAAWVCRDMQTMPALTTNIEFGEWFSDPKFIYGRPDGTPHTAYMDERYKYRDCSVTFSRMNTLSPFGNVPHNNLRSLLTAAIEGHHE